MKVLAIRSGGLGDIILTVPALIALKEISDELFISVPYQCAPLFYNFSKIIPLEGREISSLWLDGEEFLKRFGYFDIAITWHWDREGVILNNLRKIAKIVIKGEVKPKNIHQSINLFMPILKINQNFEFPKFLRLPNLPRWSLRNASEIIVHPGSGSINKVWMPENFLFLIEMLKKENFKVKIILGEAEERKEYSLFYNNIDGVELKKGISLAELISELLKGIIYIGNDSGVSHLSAMLGVPTIVIFKTTNPEIWSPKGERVYIVSTYPEKEWPEAEIVFALIKEKLKELYG
ncbi:MAG: glycosyltransferase family 9 protein [Candidatus Aminicenantia bacterium]